MIVLCERAYIAVTSEVLQELDLSQSTFCQNLLTKDIGHFLDRNPLSCLVVRGRAVILKSAQFIQRNINQR